jgi:hypothetical protein
MLAQNGPQSQPDPFGNPYVYISEVQSNIDIGSPLNNQKVIATVNHQTGLTEDKQSPLTLGSHSYRAHSGLSPHNPLGMALVKGSASNDPLCTARARCNFEIGGIPGIARTAKLDKITSTFVFKQSLMTLFANFVFGTKLEGKFVARIDGSAHITSLPTQATWSTTIEEAGNLKWKPTVGNIGANNLDKLTVDQGDASGGYEWETHTFVWDGLGAKTITIVQDVNIAQAANNPSTEYVNGYMRARVHFVITGFVIPGQIQPPAGGALGNN